MYGCTDLRFPAPLRTPHTCFRSVVYFLVFSRPSLMNTSFVRCLAHFDIHTADDGTGDGCGRDQSLSGMFAPPSGVFGGHQSCYLPARSAAWSAHTVHKPLCYLSSTTDFTLFSNSIFHPNCRSQWSSTTPTATVSSRMPGRPGTPSSLSSSSSTTSRATIARCASPSASSAAVGVTASVASAISFCHCVLDVSTQRLSGNADAHRLCPGQL